MLKYTYLLQGPIFVHETLLTDLRPFTEYVVTVEACNEFTEFTAAGDLNLFDEEKHFRTLEGGK